MASNIVLADAQATPVSHTFVPVGLDKNGVFWFEDQSQANAIGYWKISIEVTRPANAQAGTSSQGRASRVKIGLHEPILETVSNSTVSGIAPAPTVSYVMRSFTDYVLAERSALIDRKNLRKMNAGLQNDATIIACVENLLYVQ